MKIVTQQYNRVFKNGKYFIFTRKVYFNRWGTKWVFKCVVNASNAGYMTHLERTGYERARGWK